MLGLFVCLCCGLESAPLLIPLALSVYIERPRWDQQGQPALKASSRLSGVALHECEGQVFIYSAWKRMESLFDHL